MSKKTIIKAMKMKKTFIISSLLFVLILFFSILPTLLSTSVGKTWLTRMISKDLQAESVHLSWLGPQEIKQLSYPGLTCASIDTPVSLWSLLLKRDIGTLRIVKPEAVINPPVSTLHTPSPHEQKKRSSSQSFPFTGHLIVQDGDLKMQNEELNHVHFEHIQMDLNLLTPITFQASGATTQDALLGEFNVQGQLEPARDELLLDAKLTHFPIKGVDQLISLFYPNMRGILIDAVGPSFDAVVHAKLLKEGPAFSLNASSEHFRADIQTVPQNGKLVLKSPATANLTIIPALTQKLCGCSPASNAVLQLKIDDLQIPLEAPEQAQARGNLTLSTLQASPEFTLNDFKADFSTENAAKGIQLMSTAHLQFKQGLQDTLGPLATINAQGTWFINPLKGEFLVSFLSDRLRAEKLPFVFSQNQHLELMAPTAISYIPASGTPLAISLDTLDIPLAEPDQMVAKLAAQTDHLLQFQDLHLSLKIDSWQNIQLLLKENQLATSIHASYKNALFNVLEPITCTGTLSSRLVPSFPLQINPSPFELRFQPFSLNLNQPILSQLRLKAEGIIHTLSLTPKGHEEVVFERVQLKTQVDAEKEMALCELSSKGIDFHLSLDHLIFGPTLDTSKAVLGFNLDLERFSSDLLESWSGGYPIAATIGPYLDLHIKGLSSLQNQTFSVAANSQFLKAQMALAIKDNMLVLQNPNQPGKFDLTLTKEGFALINALFDPKAHFRLAQDTALSGILTQFRWPISIKENPQSLIDRLPSLQGNFADIRLQGSAGIDTLSLIEKNTSKIAHLKYLKFEFDKPAPSEPIRLHLDGLVSSKASKEGKIVLDSTLDHLFNTDGSLNRDNMVADIRGSLEHFPTLLLDFFNREAKLSKLFGPTLFVTLKAHIQKLNGPVNMTLQAPNTRASLNGQLRDGTLYLSEPIYTQVQLTPDVSKFILGSANPLSITQISADNPLTLQVDPAGFAIPLFPFDLKKMSIGNARIELGKIRCKNEGALNFTLGLLKSNQFMNNNELMLWFAPMDLQFKNGVLNVDRTELLIGETFDVALWGTIDIPGDYVDMVLGLTADALRQAFAIRNLPADYVLQIPLRGKMNNVDINKTAATAKISALLIWQNKAVRGALQGSGVGAVFGELFNKLGPLPDFDKKAPPAKKPFPWEVIEKRKTAEHAHKFNDKPLKQLYKVLRSNF